MPPAVLRCCFVTLHVHLLRVAASCGPGPRLLCASLALALSARPATRRRLPSQRRLSGGGDEYCASPACDRCRPLLRSHAGVRTRSAAILFGRYTVDGVHVDLMLDGHAISSRLFVTHCTAVETQPSERDAMTV
jgi:hypothetical protein